MRADLDELMTQNSKLKGKYINRSMSHETAKHPKNTLAASSFSEYLKTLAASMNTSLPSCRARMIEPIRKKLQVDSVLLLVLVDCFKWNWFNTCTNQDNFKYIGQLDLKASTLLRFLSHPCTGLSILIYYLYISTCTGVDISGMDKQIKYIGRSSTKARVFDQLISLAFTPYIFWWSL